MAPTGKEAQGPPHRRAEKQGGGKAERPTHKEAHRQPDFCATLLWGHPDRGGGEFIGPHIFEHTDAEALTAVLGDMPKDSPEPRAWFFG